MVMACFHIVGMLPEIQILLYMCFLERGDLLGCWCFYLLFSL